MTDQTIISETHGDDLYFQLSCQLYGENVVQF